MRRIAYCSPVSPLPSGISDYSEELLPFLGRYAEVVLFVPPGTEPTNDALRASMEIRSVEALPLIHAAQPFDAIIYHLGNSPVHAEIYEVAQRVPGVVVLHEWVLHHFKLWYTATRLGDVETYLRELKERYGDPGLAVGRRMVRGQLLEAAFDMPLSEDVVERAAGIITHSRWVFNRVKTMWPDAPAVVVPMGVPLPAEIPLATARQRLGLPLSTPIWASFGHINPYKRIEAALRAFRRFRKLEPDARYLLVGSVSPSYDLAGLIRRLGLGDSVIVLGHVSADLFALYVAASNMCLNLRYPTAGETSASSLRLLSSGRPTLVSDVGALSEFPDGVVAKIAVGAGETDHILTLGRLVSLYPDFAARWGGHARRYVVDHHSLELAARNYMVFLADACGWDPPQVERAALWELPSVTGAAQASNVPMESVSPWPLRSAYGAETDAAHTGTENSALPLRQLTRAIAQALAELGAQPNDEAVLGDVAATTASLFSHHPDGSIH